MEQEYIPKDKKYYSYLYSNDVSLQNADRFLRLGTDQKIGIQCALTKFSVQVPVRHTRLEMFTCIFELNDFEEQLDYLKKDNSYQLLSNNSFQCHTCRGILSLSAFGIDRQLYNVLCLMRAQGFIPPKFSNKNILFQPSSGKYYALSRDEKQQFEILGTVSLKTNQGNGRDFGLSQNVRFIEGVVASQIKACQLAKSKVGLDARDLPYSPSQFKTFCNGIMQSMSSQSNLIRLGKQSILYNQRNFTFGLSKTFKKTKEIISVYETIGSFLTVYFPEVGVFHDYQLTNNSGDFQYNELALSLKSQYDPKFNEVYMMGGYTLVKDQQVLTKDFYKLSFTIDPLCQFNGPRTIQVQKLPDLLQTCSQMSGICVDNVIYIFGGLTMVDNQKKVQTDIQRFQGNKWQKVLTLAHPRVEGSLYHDKANKLVYIFGGFTIINPTQVDGSQQSMTQIEIFNLQNNQLRAIQLNYGICEQTLLYHRVIFTPHQKNELLLFGGYSLYLRVNFQESKRLVFKLDLSNGSITPHYEFSYQSIDIKERQNDSRTYTCISDLEGFIYSGQYLTVYNQRQKEYNTFKVGLIQFNLNTGKCNFILFINKYSLDQLQNYLSCEQSQERAKKFCQQLGNGPTTITPLKDIAKQLMTNSQKKIRLIEEF